MPQVQLFGKLDASAAAPARPAPPAGQVNLLSPANGGQLLAAPDPGWTKLISGNDADMVSATLPQEALFAFKDEKPAIFSRFAVLIPGDGGGLPKDIELQASDQIGGPFRSLGIFTTLHARVIRDPYQEFAFPETTAKYVKVKFISGYGATGAGGFQGLTQIRLMGALK